jgi:hypothetical protein
MHLCFEKSVLLESRHRRTPAPRDNHPQSACDQRNLELREYHHR